MFAATNHHDLDFDRDALVATRLDGIIDAHRAAAARDQRDLDDLLAAARVTPTPRDFAGALKQTGLSVIAEIKRRSPSAGDLNVDLDPAQLALDYFAGGAACLSVLTDDEFFGGSFEDMTAARSVVPIPVLRKDFTVDARDVVDARIVGADAVLLIVAALSDNELRVFGALADELQLAALFEVHDEAELERALGADARIVGVNQRDLHTFDINYDLAAELAPNLIDVTSVAESGIRNAEDAVRIAESGYDSILVGTSLVTSDSPEAMVQQLSAAGGVA